MTSQVPTRRVPTRQTPTSVLLATGRSRVPLAAALFLATLAPAMAQGTAAQRAACAPDAVKLCPDTIPDVARTKACMLRHESELSQRCRAVFNSAVNNAPGAATQGPAEESETGDAADIAHARVLIGRLCRHDVLDPGTCAVTSNALDLAQ